jgi:hypothetical protein
MHTLRVSLRRPTPKQAMIGEARLGQVAALEAGSQ